MLPRARSRPPEVGCRHCHYGWLRWRVSIRARPLKTEVDGQLVVCAVLRRILLEQGLAVRRVEVEPSHAAVRRGGGRFLGGSLFYPRAPGRLPRPRGGLLPPSLLVSRCPPLCARLP